MKPRDTCPCGEDHDSKDHAHDLERKDSLGTNIPSPIPTPDRRGSRATRRYRGPKGFPWEKPIPFNTRDIHRELRKYTDPSEKRVARWLFSTWNAQADAIKFQEIDNAIRDGELSPKWLTRWRSDYNRFVNESLDPEWRLGVSEGADYTAAKISDALGIAWEFPETTKRIERWIDENGGKLIVELASEQERAVRNMLRFSIADEGLSSTELAKRLRPMVGLTEREVVAVQNRRAKLDELVEKGKLRATQVDGKVRRYNDFLLRRRATRIARTETAGAFNFGAFEGVREAVAEGLVKNNVIKKFSTADDERVCPFCGALDGKTVGLEQTFPGLTKRVPFTLVPPVHPQCRCTIIYEMVDDKRRPATRPPLPKGVNVANADNAQELQDKFFESLDFGQQARAKLSSQKDTAPWQIYNALERAKGSKPDFLGGVNTRVLVSQSDAGDIVGAAAYKIDNSGAWELMNLGSMTRGSGEGSNLFAQFARDAVAHDASVKWTTVKGTKGFWTKLGFKADPDALNYNVNSKDLATWLQKNGISVSGGAIAKPIKKPTRARPVVAKPPRNIGAIDVETVEAWKPVQTKKTAVERMKSHFSEINISSTFRKHIVGEQRIGVALGEVPDLGDESRLVALLNMLDLEMVRLKNSGAIPSGVSMRKLKFSTAGNREKWNGYYDWKERTGRSSAETARQYYSEGDIAINIGTTYGEKIPSSLIGATDPDDFIKFIDKANTTSLTPPPVGKPVRFGTSGGISLNTLRHELGHSLSISVRNMEAKAIRAGIFIENELWDRWDVLYRRATPRGPNDKTAKAARVISEYSTRNADEFFAECFSMMHAEGFKEGTLDAGLGLEGVEQAVRNIVDALQ